MKKIIVLVLTYDDGGGYSDMDNIVRKTWGTQDNDNVKIYYYYAKLLGDSEYIIDGDKIYCNGNESLSTIGEKTIKALKYLINEDFDYLVRPNSSSFIHIPNLIKYLNDKPTERFYSGQPIPYHTNQFSMYFASGSSYILSKDLVEYVVKNSDKWNHLYQDDVSIGELIIKHGVELTPYEWLKINEMPDENILNDIKDKFQIRCKIENRFDIDEQVTMFKKLNKLIYNKD